jgi:hypothetical protein
MLVFDILPWNINLLEAVIRVKQLLFGHGAYPWTQMVHCVAMAEEVRSNSYHFQMRAFAAVRMVGISVSIPIPISIHTPLMV